jgi:hypothetical protein
VLFATLEGDKTRAIKDGRIFLTSKNLLPVNQIFSFVLPIAFSSFNLQQSGIFDSPAWIFERVVKIIMGTTCEATNLEHTHEVRLSAEATDGLIW